MAKYCLKEIRVPDDLKARVKRLARLNGLTPSELIRLSVETQLPGIEADKNLSNASDGTRSKNHD